MPDDIDPAKELADFVEAQLKEVITGDQQDIRKYAEQIVSDALRLVDMSHDEADDMMKELAAQALLLGEVQRLRAVNAGFAMFDKAIRVGMAIAIKGMDLAL